MTLDEENEWRRERLQELTERFEGNAALGRALKYKDGAFVGQMIKGVRPITEKTMLAVELLPGYSGWFNRSKTHPGSIDLTNNPEYPAVRRVRFKLSAGASGYGIEYQQGDATPLVFNKTWYAKRCLQPSKLFAVPVSNGSMEPGLHDGDVVVVNTEVTKPKDGIVFAVNYEGELVIKRLIRDAGQWWLSSDNSDQRRYPRKVCDENVFLLGEIVHKQSEKI